MAEFRHKKNTSIKRIETKEALEGTHTLRVSQKEHLNKED